MGGEDGDLGEEDEDEDCRGCWPDLGSLEVAAVLRAKSE